MLHLHRPVLLVAALICSPLFAAAAVFTPDCYGIPEHVEADADAGVYRIWFADGTWHMRTSTEDYKQVRGSVIVFTGSVVSEDKVTSEGVKIEKRKDWITPHADGKGFDFHFETHGAKDEVDFTAGSDGKTLKFKLMLDGKDVPPSRVFIGKNASNPEKSEFTLPAHPQPVAPSPKTPSAAPKTPPAPPKDKKPAVATPPNGKPKLPDDE